ncbi:glycosyltransferase BC10-like [Impatiens glandulifera]|uniref:glycosyltransferase BC10-like n=1 Tax=Impatiens glandulifera TaxID=253017 RepID=UPI001FB07860|nr:glycosyltransferase BC10-like [Impatiens glandulifera]
MSSSSPFLLLFTLLLSLPLIFLYAPTFIFHPRHSQISTADELDDLALFRRTALTSVAHRRSRTSVSHLGPTHHKPKIAFLFLTNTNLHFAPLWEKFFKGNERFYNIYVHAYPSSAVSSPGGVFENRFIAAKNTQRSSPTLISAARRLLATAILDDPLNSYFALVSQHCIPLHSFRFTYRTLFPGSTRELTHPTSYIEILSDEPQLWDRYTARGDDVMLPEVPFEKFRVGSQFYVLARRHALLIVKDRKLWSKFRLPCINADSCYPEEHYFPTLLSMADPKGCSHYTLTRVNWTGSTDGHPYTYSPPEVSSELIGRLRQSNSTRYSYLFARKFSPDCLEPLLRLEEKIIFRD